MDEAAENSPIDPLLEALQRYWGYEEFRPLQREAIESVMQVRDSLVVMPTGGGKSLCYQVPAVCLPGTAIIISPLLSLMKDQVDAALACGIAAATLNSAQTPGAQRDVLASLREGELKMLYVSPERAVQNDFLRSLEEITLSLFAIDEAHCVSQWGHDFRPHYRQLKVLRDRFPHVGMHGFTATATKQVRDDIQFQLNLREPLVLVGNFDRHNLRYQVERKGRLADRILEVLRKHPRESGIIYCITRAEVERWSSILQAAGYRVRPYHAGLSDEVRQRNQEDFIRDRADIVVATVAFGMGIDKSNVRFVIHAGMPQSLEHYQQESGRAGRDGLPSSCYLYFGGDDLQKWQRIFSDQPADVRKISTQSLNAITSFCEGIDCRHRLIVRHFEQDLDHDCGDRCDICLEDREVLPDALVISQKIISSVYRQEQRFGADYTSLVLKGSYDRRIVENGHEQLSTWGLLKQFDKGLILSWIGQLTQQGFLLRAEENNALQITEQGKLLLKGELGSRLLGPARGAAKSLSGSVENDPAAWEGVDRGLFERLRDERVEIAQERNVPAYLIFNDATLRALATQRPSNRERLLMVSGIGQKKADDFGERFLSIIAAWCRDHDLPTDSGTKRRIASNKSPKSNSVPAAGSSLTANAIAAFPLFAGDVSIESVMDLVKKTRATVMNYLAQYLESQPGAKLGTWVPEETVSRVRDAIATVGDDRLKPIYLHLNEQIDYDTIRLVIAAAKNPHLVSSELKISEASQSTDDSSA